MALKNCKECGHQVSDKADSCPQCGAKIKKGLPRWVVWGVFIFVFAAIIGSCQDESNSKANNSDGGSTSSQDSTKSGQINKTPQNWSYEGSKDEMRGTKSSTAYTVSKNKVDFEFPYSGGSNLNLLVRNNAGQKDVIISISKGQFLCGLMDGCEVNFKFDDGSVQSVTMIGSDSHDTDILFVKHPKTVSGVIEKIKKSKKLIIEPRFFQAGSKQFTFDLTGFKEP
jgi:invasion protein IalB